MVTKFRTLYGMWGFIPVFTVALRLSCPDSDQSSLYRHVSLLYHHVVSVHLKSGRFLYIPTKILYGFSMYCARAVRTAHQVLTYVIIPIIFARIAIFEVSNSCLFSVAVCCFVPSYIKYEMLVHRRHHHIIIIWLT